MEKENKTTNGWQEGNQWWRKRTTHGRKKIFSTPEILRKAAIEYFEETDKRKWEKKDFKGNKVKEVTYKTSTPYTISGLCVYLGVNSKYFNDFEKNLDLTTKKGADYSEVVGWIRDVMFTQKFEGAAVGAFSQAIIAQEIGLRTKNELIHTIEQPMFGDDND